MAVSGDLTACMHVFLYFAAVAQVWHVTQDYYIQFLFLKLVQSSRIQLQKNWPLLKKYVRWNKRDEVVPTSLCGIF